MSMNVVVLGTTVDVSVSGQRICRLAEEVAAAPDPETALAGLTELREELDEFERQQVASALTSGRSFGAVARAMGISRQAVHRRFSDLSPRRRRPSRGLEPTPEVRLVFEYARAEAARSGTPVLAPEHMVLGVLRAGDPRGAAALTKAGVDLDEVQRAARAAAGRALRRGARDVDIRAVLADSVRCATSKGADRIEAEHVLRAALARMDGEGELGVPPESVVAALDAPAEDRQEA